jgi:cytochrome c-type biogenesis protein CcmH
MRAFKNAVRPDMLWILMTVLMVAAALLIVGPIFLRGQQTAGSKDSVYLSQLKEVEREETLGLIPAEDAQLARLEIKRRLANTDVEQIHNEETNMRRSDQFTLVGIVAVMVLGSGILYSVVGSPGVPASAHKPAGSTMAGPPLTRSSQQSAMTQANPNGVAPVDELLTRLEDRLSLNPDDVEGWRMLGWSRFRMGDVEGARQAYKRAIDLDASDPNTLSAYGEALIRLGGGRISDEAADALQQALALNPTDPRARFLLGLKKQQDGAPEAALEDWITLLASSSPGDEWRDDVRTRILELADKLGTDVTARLPADVQTAAPGPSATDVAAAAQMPEAERQAMIEGMVSRLDQKMRDNPDDLEGWIRLIRARKVLGQADLTQDALSRAKAAFAGDASALQQLDEAANTPAAD